MTAHPAAASGHPPAPDRAVTALRAARAATGWSQSEAAARLVAVAGDRGIPVAGAASLKTQLSRWENGHAVPDEPYRELLGELYRRTPADLGIAPRPSTDRPDGPAALRAALTEAAAAGRAGPRLWWDQLAAAVALDDELGAAGAGGLVDALLERLTATALHTVDPAALTGVSAVLAATAGLAAAQSLDTGRHDVAWSRYTRSGDAARRAGLPAVAAAAAAGRAEVLVDAGEPAVAVELLRHTDPAGDHTAGVLLAAATGVAAAAAGDRSAAERALAEAEQRWRARPVDVVEAPPGIAVQLADLHRWHGRALVDLADTAAVGQLERALDAPQRTARHRAGVHADLSVALRADRPEEAARHAATARELAAGIGSRRVAARLAGPIPGRAGP